MKEEIDIPYGLNELLRPMERAKRLEAHYEIPSAGTTPLQHVPPPRKRGGGGNGGTAIAAL